MPNKRYLEIQEEMYARKFSESQVVSRFRELLSQFNPTGEKEMHVWVTSVRQVILVPFMRPEHIRNAYRFSYRHLEKLHELYPIISMKPRDARVLYDVISGMKALHTELIRRKMQAPKWNELWDVDMELAWGRASGRIGLASEIGLFLAQRDPEYDDWFWE